MIKESKKKSLGKKPFATLTLVCTFQNHIGKKKERTVCVNASNKCIGHYESVNINDIIVTFHFLNVMISSEN